MRLTNIFRNNKLVDTCNSQKLRNDCLKSIITCVIGEIIKDITKHFFFRSNIQSWICTIHASKFKDECTSNFASDYFLTNKPNYGKPSAICKAALYDGTTMNSVTIPSNYNIYIKTHIRKQIALFVCVCMF